MPGPGPGPPGSHRAACSSDGTAVISSTAPSLLCPNFYVKLFEIELISRRGWPGRCRGGAGLAAAAGGADHGPRYGGRWPIEFAPGLPEHERTIPCLSPLA